MTSIPPYILERVRRPIPADSFVIPGSTPVVSFGNVQAAHVATLGLNPSKREFFSDTDTWLTGEARRLATLDSLGVTALAGASDVVAEAVVDDCYQYFKRQPYLRWFRPLESVLTRATRASYLNDTACHLDLVQWATDPVWQKLLPDIQARLIAEDREFLAKQLQQERIKLVLINGRSVMRQVGKMGVGLARRQQLRVGSAPCDIVVGSKYDTTFIGWSVNLQSSFGVSNAFKAALAEEVGGLVDRSVQGL